MSDPVARTRLAYHEAGHVVAALAVGRRVQVVTIDPLVSGPYGFAFAAPVKGDGSPESLRHDLRITLAGHLAEAWAMKRGVGAKQKYHADPDDPDSIYMSPLEANLAAQLERAIETPRPGEPVRRSRTWQRRVPTRSRSWGPLGTAPCRRRSSTSTSPGSRSRRRQRRLSRGSGYKVRVQTRLHPSS